MGETLIRALISLCLLVLAVIIVFWVLGILGVVLPGMVETIIWVVVGLIALLYLYRALGGSKLF